MANIQFNNIKEIGLSVSAMPIGIDGLTEDLIAENGGIINATQIDWNGAQVAGKTLNTTGEVLTLIGDNNTNIETLKQHSHANYATKTYVTEEINKVSGGSGLDVEDYTDTLLNYNLLVSPEGSKYTELGSLNNGSDWCSDLWAGVDENGYATLYSSKFNGELIGEHKHSHTNYATKSYVTEEINKVSGGSGLGVEDYTDGSVNYNLLVAPEGSKYTELGSLSDGGTWTSQLYATVDVSNSETTLYSTYFEGKFRGELPHAHTNYVTVTSFNSRIKNLESRIEYLESYLSYIFDEDTSTPTISAITGVTVKVTGGVYGTDGKTGTLDDKYTMRQFSDGSSDTLNFVLTGNPSNANATFMMNYDDNCNGDINDTLVKVAKTQISNGLRITATMNSNSEEWSDGDWTRYTVEASNSENYYTKTLYLDLSYIYVDDNVYFYVGQTQPTAINYDTIGTAYSASDYPSTVEYTAPQRNYVYILVTEDKEVSKIVDSNGMTNGFSEVNSGITGYRLYKTDGGIAAGGKIIITIA